jgi:hypothetical protein
MIPSGKLIACDTETTGLNPWKGDRPFAFSFCNEKGDAGFSAGRLILSPEKSSLIIPSSGG